VHAAAAASRLATGLPAQASTSSSRPTAPRSSRCSAHCSSALPGSPASSSARPSEPARGRQGRVRVTDPGAAMHAAAPAGLRARGARRLLTRAHHSAWRHSRRCPLCAGSARRCPGRLVRELGTPRRPTAYCGHQVLSREQGAARLTYADAPWAGQQHFGRQQRGRAQRAPRAVRRAQRRRQLHQVAPQRLLRGRHGPREPCRARGARQRSDPCCGTAAAPEQLPRTAQE